MKEQPTKIIIKQKLELILTGELTQEEVGDWAMDYVVNDELVEWKDLKAWDFLLAVSGVGEKIAPDQYLYCHEDIQDWLKEYC